MARKSKDLFQLLQNRRSRGSFKVTPDPDPRQPFDPVGAVGEWFRGLTGWSPRKRKPKRRTSSSASGILVSGPTLAGLAFGSLVVGFLLGQSLGGGSPDDLRAAEKREPELLPATHSAGELSSQEQIHNLSASFYLLGAYPTGSDEPAARASAEKLAEYLRRQGLERTRIYKHYADKNGDTIWVTLYYTEGEGVDQAALDRLRSVPPPAFEPRWSQFMEALAQSPQPAILKRP